MLTPPFCCQIGEGQQVKYTNRPQKESRARAYTRPPAGGRICRPGAQPLPLISGPRNTLAPEGPGHPGPSAFAASGMVWGDAVRLPPFQRGQRGLGSWPQPAGQSPILPVAAATPLPAREPRVLIAKLSKLIKGYSCQE